MPRGDDVGPTSVSRVGGGCRRVATRRTRVSLESGFFVCAVRWRRARASVGITRRARIHSHTKLRSRCLPLRCIASIGPRMDFRIYPGKRTVRVRCARARRGEATEGTRAMRTRGGRRRRVGIVNRVDCRRARGGARRSGDRGWMCVWRVLFAIVLASRRRRASVASASARRRFVGIKRHADVSKRRFGRRSTGVSCVWVYSTY